MKKVIALVFCLWGSHLFGQNSSDSVFLYIHVDPTNATLKLNGDTIPNRTLFKVAQGTYSFSCHGLNLNSIYDTIEVYSEAKKSVSFSYQMQLNGSVVLNETYYKAKFIGGCLALANSSALSIRQLYRLDDSYVRIENLVTEIEGHPNGHELIPSYEDEVAYYNQQQKILIASYAAVAASSYFLYRNRVKRNKNRQEYLDNYSLRISPYYDPNLNICGSSLYFQF